MKEKTIFLDIKIDTVLKLLKEKIEKKSITCNLVDKYKQTINDKIIYILILEKYFIRVENRITITIVIDDFEGKTRIHFKAAGGSASFITKFDWGAADKLEQEVYSIFEKHIIN